MFCLSCSIFGAPFAQVVAMIITLELPTTTNFIARWNKMNARAHQILGRRATAIKLLFQDNETK